MKKFVLSAFFGIGRIAEPAFGINYLFGVQEDSTDVASGFQHVDSKKDKLILLLNRTEAQQTASFDCKLFFNSTVVMKIVSNIAQLV